MRILLAIAGVIVAVVCTFTSFRNKSAMDGAAEAHRDIMSGNIKHMAFGEPMPENGYFAENLKTDFGVTLVMVGGCVIDESARKRAEAYNTVMQKHLTQKFGRDVISEAGTKAQERWVREHLPARP